METGLISQTTPQSTSSSCSSSYEDFARVVQLTVYSPQKQSVGNEGAMVAGRAIEGLRYIEQVATTSKEWKKVEERFDQVAFKKTGLLAPVVNRSGFAYCIGMKETPEFADELLGALKRKREQHCEITKTELHDYWCRITDTNFHSRTQIFFDLCDRNMDGKITEKEIKQVILLSASANKLCITLEEAQEHAALIMEELDDENRGYIEYRNRKAFEVMGYCLCTAKGAAETLKFNMALILLPVCRNTITWLRKNRSLNSIIPFNDNINFHKLIAAVIVIGVILHGGTHLACDFPRIAGCSHSIFRTTIGADFQNHQPSYIEILATIEAATGITMVLLMAIAFCLATRLPRRSPSSLPWPPLQRLTGFNTFWYSHHLFIFVYALLIVHSMFLFLTKDVTEKTTWMYIAIPVLLYASERVVRVLRSGLYNVNIIKATTFPGKVLSLKLSKPAGFRHPFSLTSAPEDDHLGVHIRTLGDWSYRIYSLFQEALLSGSTKLPKISIDGPYGAASQDHVKYDIVMLIGLGIGATPFISILRDIVHGLHKTLIDHINDEESNITKGPSKAYLYWVTREQSSFEWFQDVMKELSDTNRRQTVIEMHNFLTSVYQDGDTRSALITAIQALQHAKSGTDIISRTAVRTHFSRPNWLKIFSKLASRHAGAKIGVFYCGPSHLAKELEKLCTENTTKTSTRFVFHKENY
ncbi:hypothetical protein IFM89_038495 [Coptis chinensis]|uniref:Uncharacterized protein n=1 Tax=Coptis chinensis TaxID=261450 RepID=A0A835J0B6_9MAGN|nr:hypothetical protein IFM89_038495 [Coptis chinensis]